MLSPFTWWNDLFINIPISYLLASIVSFFYPESFIYATVVFYWLTNILGILLMFKGAKELVVQKKINHRKIILTVVFMIIYSIILVVLERTNLLRPFFKCNHN
jgi:hypothetical protein